MNSLCQYKNMFGKSKEGVHSFRVLGVAIVDVVFTFLAAFVIQYFTGGNYWFILICLFILAIFLHRLFCVDTALNKLIF